MTSPLSWAELKRLAAEADNKAATPFDRHQAEMELRGAATSEVIWTLIASLEATEAESKIWRTEASTWQQVDLAKAKVIVRLRASIADLLSYTMPMTPVTIKDTAKALLAETEDFG